MRVLCVLFLFFPLMGFSQQLRLVSKLESAINETSGLIYFNNKVITHNDSGDEPALYELDINNGKITRKVYVKDADHVDWEDITFDKTYIYIGDFGNNLGKRTDLKIYRVSISDYIHSSNDTVTAEIIRFSYADQTDFTSKKYATNFDAEAMIAYNGNIYVFTKNWLDSWTNVYTVPSSPGTYSAPKIDSINVQGLITGATYNFQSNIILLTAYSISGPFIIQLSSFSANLFSNGSIEKIPLETPAGCSVQIEAITFFDENICYLTAEENSSGAPALYELKLQNTLSIKDANAKGAVVYPNPVSTILIIEFDKFFCAELYTIDGVLNRTTEEKKIDVTGMKPGVYFLVLKDVSGLQQTRRKLLIF
ncbi:T9SS type A sorting domain-containing protein [Pontibacter sp. MBLB2868]|uniref:T9SS type A sorting domain-containing protein n=1 Tax=Pontibacter sp. MBLB2868 TaxID=3451555 RepID=UPI003F74C5F9